MQGEEKKRPRPQQQNSKLDFNNKNKNKTGPGALAAPHAGLGRRGHLERRHRRDARSRGAGAGEEGALRCRSTEEERRRRREERREAREARRPQILLLPPASSPLLLSHRRHLFTLSPFCVPYLAHSCPLLRAPERLKGKRLCEPRKTILPLCLSFFFLSF